MQNFLKTLLFLVATNLTNTTIAQDGAIQIAPGSQTDTHGCVSDGGYTWCESTQQCQRAWETVCEDTTTSFCQSSPPQTCRSICPQPSCQPNQCAMRYDGCCATFCTESKQQPLKEPPIPLPIDCGVCPPERPCPRPAMDSNCVMVYPNTDQCGCTIGCPSIDCSSRTNIVAEGGTCGGFMPYGRAGVCDTGLECTYTMGPMVADAPGTCLPICPTTRDNYGNCIDESIPQIPENCVTWFDGCNTCSYENGYIQGCTMMMCFTQNEPYCQVFTSGELNLGDMCYRFCEDGSQNTINRQKDCPIGTECGATTTSNNVISFDSCGTRAHTCNIVSGH
jgi:hypothetical protein